jgi:hypothetical protein
MGDVISEPGRSRQHLAESATGTGACDKPSIVSCAREDGERCQKPQALAAIALWVSTKQPTAPLNQWIDLLWPKVRRGHLERESCGDESSVVDLSIAAGLRPRPAESLEVLNDFIDVAALREFTHHRLALAAFISIEERKGLVLLGDKA